MLLYSCNLWRYLINPITRNASPVAHVPIPASDKDEKQASDASAILASLEENAAISHAIAVAAGIASPLNAAEMHPLDRLSLKEELNLLQIIIEDWFKGSMERPFIFPAPQNKVTRDDLSSLLSFLKTVPSEKLQIFIRNLRASHPNLEEGHVVSLMLAVLTPRLRDYSPLDGFDLDYVDLANRRALEVLLPLQLPPAAPYAAPPRHRELCLRR